MAMPPAPVTYYYHANQYRNGAFTQHLPITDPFQRAQVRLMGAMVKGGDLAALYSISEVARAAGLGWSVQTQTGPTSVGGDGSCVAGCCSAISFLDHLKNGEHQLNEGYTWAGGVFSTVLENYVEHREGGNPFDDATHQAYLTNVAAAGDSGPAAEKVRKTPSWPGSWANFSLLSLHSHRDSWANLHILSQPNTFLAEVGRRGGRAAVRSLPQLHVRHDP